MTREKALEILRHIFNTCCAECISKKCEGCELEALDMAIEALDRQKGEWANIPIGNLKQCSNCGYICTPILADQTENIYNFCPNCGADMRGEEL